MGTDIEVLKARATILNAKSHANEPARGFRRVSRGRARDFQVNRAVAKPDVLQNRQRFPGTFFVSRRADFPRWVVTSACVFFRSRREISVSGICSVRAAGMGEKVKDEKTIWKFHGTGLECR